MAMRGVKLDIEGMHCDGCIRSVTNVLGRVKGVRVVDVQVGAARVELDDAQATDQDLARAIEKAGFVCRGSSPTG
jgi:copper chaperone